MVARRKDAHDRLLDFEGVKVSRKRTPRVCRRLFGMGETVCKERRRSDNTYVVNKAAATTFNCFIQ